MEEKTMPEHKIYISKELADMLPNNKSCSVCGVTYEQVSRGLSFNRLRFYKGKWYCDRPLDREHSCFQKVFDEESTTVKPIKISVICPFDKTDVGDIVLEKNGETGVCPTCGAEFKEDGEGDVTFIRKKPEEKEGKSENENR